MLIESRVSLRAKVDTHGVPTQSETNIAKGRLIQKGLSMSYEGREANSWCGLLFIRHLMIVE